MEHYIKGKIFPTESGVKAAIAAIFNSKSKAFLKKVFLT
jgi:hypothetical protein